jgi:hypothetical protein
MAQKKTATATKTSSNKPKQTIKRIVDEPLEQTTRAPLHSEELNFEPEYKELPIAEKIKLIFTNPIQFFQKTKTEKSKLTDAWIYLLLLAIPYAILSAMIAFILGPFIAKVTSGFLSLFSAEIAKLYLDSYLESATLTILDASISVPLTYVTVTIGVFFSAFLVWVIMLTLAKPKYEDLFKLITYAQTPTLVYGWVPFIGIIAFFHTIVLQVVGGSKYLEISYMRSFIGIVLIPLIIIGTIFVLMFIALLLVAFATEPSLVY